MDPGCASQSTAADAEDVDDAALRARLARDAGRAAAIRERWGRLMDEVRDNRPHPSDVAPTDPYYAHEPPPGVAPALERARRAAAALGAALPVAWQCLATAEDMDTADDMDTMDTMDILVHSAGDLADSISTWLRIVADWEGPADVRHAAALCVAAACDLCLVADARLEEYDDEEESEECLGVSVRTWKPALCALAHVAREHLLAERFDRARELLRALASMIRHSVRNGDAYGSGFDRDAGMLRPTFDEDVDAEDADVEGDDSAAIAVRAAARDGLLCTNSACQDAAARVGALLAITRDDLQRFVSDDALRVLVQHARGGDGDADADGRISARRADLLSIAARRSEDDAFLDTAWLPVFLQAAEESHRDEVTARAEQPPHGDGDGAASCLFVRAGHDAFVSGDCACPACTSDARAYPDGLFDARARLRDAVSGVGWLLLEEHVLDAPLQRRVAAVLRDALAYPMSATIAAHAKGAVRYVFDDTSYVAAQTELCELGCVTALLRAQGANDIHLDRAVAAILRSRARSPAPPVLDSDAACAQATAVRVFVTDAGARGWHETLGACADAAPATVLAQIMAAARAHAESSSVRGTQALSALGARMDRESWRPYVARFALAFVDAAFVTPSAGSDADAATRADVLAVVDGIAGAQADVLAAAVARTRTDSRHFRSALLLLARASTLVLPTTYAWSRVVDARAHLGALVAAVDASGNGVHDAATMLAQVDVRIVAARAAQERALVRGLPEPPAEAAAAVRGAVDAALAAGGDCLFCLEPLRDRDAVAVTACTLHRVLCCALDMVARAAVGRPCVCGQCGAPQTTPYRVTLDVGAPRATAGHKRAREGDGVEG